MKKLLSATGIVLVLFTACNNSGTKETTTNSTEMNATDNKKTTETPGRAKEISDSTKMLDKKLADPNSKYSPDSMK